MTVDEYDELNARLKKYEALEGDIEQAKELSENIEAFVSNGDAVKYTITVTPIPKVLSEVGITDYPFNDTSMTFNQSVGSMLAELLNKHVAELERQLKEL